MPKFVKFLLPDKKLADEIEEVEHWKVHAEFSQGLENVQELIFGQVADVAFVEEFKHFDVLLPEAAQQVFIKKD